MSSDPTQGSAVELVFLGSGTSHGIPMIGCDCAICRSNDPRDSRNRSSVAVCIETPAGPRGLLIDVAPEFRISAIACQLRRVDAVLITHAHADHVMGMDDLRRYNNLSGASIDVFGPADAISAVRKSFGYAVGAYDNPDRPSLLLHEIDGPVRTAGVAIQPIPLMHGRQEILGYRIDDFAYCTDCSAIPEASRPMLAGLDVLVLDALRYTPHPTHFNVAQALEVIEQLKPRRTFLTHLAHEISHERTSRDLPAGVELAYDGLRVRLDRI